ncbi:hypothetical protein ACFO3D_01685 [Virgibacillus kekensis]|uniref:EfeO-type cupredoxin-like domain-containing protein n=1 Tax=Virgibacillus kekensis TaxID=202261 RepID=A0ABV9DEU6_9BACI
MRRSLVVLFLLSVCLIGSLYWFYGRAGTELAAKKTVNVEEDDFVLHIHVENDDSGFQVYRSLQYLGQGKVEITHRTPLISVSFKQKNHDYTGSNVTEVLDNGRSYYPQGPVSFESPEQGTYKLYCETRFTVNGEKVRINLEETLAFQ